MTYRLVQWNFTNNPKIISSERVANWEDGGSNNTAVDVSGLNAGIYLIQIQTELGKTNKKIIRK